MATTRTLIALLLTTMVSGVALAQDSAEYGRSSGGQLELATKSPARFHGSLGFTTSRSSGRSVFGDALGGYGMTAGGTILKDKMWFFAAADRSEVRMPNANAATVAIPRFAATSTAQLGAGSSLGASFYADRGAAQMTIPSSFLSLRYTGIVSSNMFFTASVSRSSRSPQ